MIVSIALEDGKGPEDRVALTPVLWLQIDNADPLCSTDSQSGCERGLATRFGTARASTWNYQIAFEGH